MLNPFDKTHLEAAMIQDPQVVNNLSILTKTVGEHLKSQRRIQRIKTGAIVLGIAAYLAILGQGLHKNSMEPTGKPYASLVRIDGEIAAKKEASLYNLEESLEQAYKDKESKGVILVINSPGGSPVQSAMIHDKIEFLKEKYKKKTYVVGEDMLTSGAYLIAVAGDEIYVDNSTIAGSIGVVSRSYGFPELMKKLGVENRTTTAGTNKARNDPFSPQTDTDKEKLKAILTKLHTHFIDIVKKGRGDKLKEDANLFSGDFWTGDESVQLGLADGIGNVDFVLKEKLNVESVQEYSKPTGLRELLMSGLGKAMASAASQTLESELKAPTSSIEAKL